jgi:hypothetical protein
MSTTYANGEVPPHLLATLDGQPEASLRADAAAAWNRARAAVKARTGITLRVRGWNRTRAEQVTFYLQRHRLARKGERVCCRWQGRGYVFTGTAHAAPPGTSNHGWGLAVDVEDYGGVGRFDHPRRVATFPILAEHGWTDTEGRGPIREPWHLVYDPARDRHRNTPTPPTAPDLAPVPDVQEDDMRGLIEALYRRRLGREGSTREVDDWVISAAELGKTPTQLVDVFEDSRAEDATVRAAFLDFLGREPGQHEITGWLAGGTLVEQVRDGIERSPEALAKKGS